MAYDIVTSTITAETYIEPDFPVSWYIIINENPFDRPLNFFHSNTPGLQGIIEEIDKDKHFGIAIRMFPVRQSNKNADGLEDKRRIGSVYYYDLSTNVVSLRSRQLNELFILPSGYYIIVPTITELNLKSLKYIFRIFSYDDVTVEQLACKESQRFNSKENKYIKIISLRS
ncbi:unnamed protein product [Didymodactylos carnosus]|uniref:Uncharacterized protein n=1 Tax=Didymodactylos carnosus TaxID=1234261 RepID=A0A814WU37_9BILA|nr:unnamed protein product [Didymodactylos carnosus]CAF3967246.1 unnamed protein product [Didymodactylos carnosus]